MLEFIKIINSDYAGVLSLLSSLIMVVVTIIYVGHTKRQANYAKESAELVAKQMKILVKSLHLQSKQVHHYLTLELATSIIETRLVQQKQTVVLATLLRQTEMG